MQNVSVVDIARRYKQNPLLTPGDVKPSTDEMTVESLLNSGVFSFNKKTWLLIRVSERAVQKKGFVNIPIYDESGEIEILEFDKNNPDLDFSDHKVIRFKNKFYKTTLSHLRLMYSDDGKEFYEHVSYPPVFGKGVQEEFGIEDCRVTEIDGIFSLTYTMLSSFGVGVGLIQTRDWQRYDRKGMIFPPDNRGCAIFEEKIRGKYWALHQGSAQSGGNYIWIAESPDLIHWGNHKCIVMTRDNMWDSESVSAGCSPIRTPKGWLTIYHGVDENQRCCLGALLLDVKDPSAVIGRSEFPFMEPTEDYELNELSGNSVITIGHLVVGDTVKLFYGAANQVICGAEFSIQEILFSMASGKSLSKSIP